MARFLDVNVWLPLVWEGHVASSAARDWLAGEQEDLVLCRVTQLALLRHLTNPAIMGKEVLTTSEASQLLRHVRSQDAVLFAVEPAGLDRLFPPTAESPAPHRNPWTDAYLAAFAISGKHELVTFDRGFARFEVQGLRWRLLELEP